MNLWSWPGESFEALIWYCITMQLAVLVYDSKLPPSQNIYIVTEMSEVICTNVHVKNLV